jgi:hypothetical protein
MAQKNNKTVNNFIFEVLDVLFFRAEGISFSLDVLYGGRGISKLQFLNKKREERSTFSPFLFIKPWIRIRIHSTGKISAIYAGEPGCLNDLLDERRVLLW